MEITEIRRIVNLLKKVNCADHAVVSEVAREMGIKKTALMQFIEDNPKLFSLGEAFTQTSKASTSQGLAIAQAYLSADENPDTDEWMEKMKSTWENKIHIEEQTYYGTHEYWYIPVDSGKKGLYRNTPEKIKFLTDSGIIKKVSGGYGGLSDYYSTEYYAFGESVQKALEEIGWETDFKQ